MSEKPQILDCSLRDGSYAINFQFSTQETRVIVEGLQNAGIKWIEVGHGVGLNASDSGHGKAKESDSDYIKAAVSSKGESQVGVFCIPGIARLEDLENAIDHGIDFVRIGTNVEEAGNAESFIKLARAKGITVMANFMKSYAATPEQFTEYANEAAGYGAQCIYVVDSAGGMIPDDVRAYIDTLKSKLTDVHIGFHGHNNLGLAEANSLAALESGAWIIDASLQGLGRSSGNTVLEKLILLLVKIHGLTAIDIYQLMDLGEEYVRPLLQIRGQSSLDLISGYAQFHSSYMGLVNKAAEKHGIDPRKLIVALTEVDKVNAAESLVNELAASLAQSPESAFKPRFKFQQYFGSEQSR